MTERTNSKIVCDTDFLISLHITNESTHLQAVELYQKFVSCDFLVLNITKYEMATVLSRKFSHPEAISILNTIDQNFGQEIWFDQSWQSEVFTIYNDQTRKNTSFFDCACLFLARKYKAKIASFDSFYPAGLLLK